MSSHTVQLYSESGKTVIDDVTVTIKNGIAYTQGDIIVGYVDGNGTLISSGSIDEGNISTMSVSVSSTVLGRHWDDGVVPYDFSGISTNTAAAVRMAMDAIEPESGVRFIPRASQTDYVTFAEVNHSESLCAAQVGRQGGAQIVQLASYCRDTSTISQSVIIHELFHVLGFFHEHTRADRDDFIVVHWENLTEEGALTFEKLDNGFSHLTSYDYESIMHYARYTSSTELVVDDALPRLTRLDFPGLDTGSLSMSPKDQEGLRIKYGFLPKPVLNAPPFFCYGQVQLSWKLEPNADNYRLEYFDSSHFPYWRSNDDDKFDYYHECQPVSILSS